MNSKITLGILSAVIGLLVVVNPKASIEVIVILIGISSVINGIGFVAKLKSFSLNPNLKRVLIAKSAAGILIGLLAVILPFAVYNFVETVIRIFLYVQGIYLVVSAASQIAMVFMLDDSLDKKPFAMEAFWSVVIAVLLFMLPAGFGVKIIRAAGILILLFGILFTVKELKSRPIEVEAEEIKTNEAE